LGSNLQRPDNSDGQRARCEVASGLLGTR
jgi:hypothetical protein